MDCLCTSQHPVLKKIKFADSRQIRYRRGIAGGDQSACD
jgi:hypothetical protein